MKKYDEMDLNKDGKVDREEVVAAAKEQGKTLTQAELTEMESMFT